MSTPQLIIGIAFSLLFIVALCYVAKSDPESHWATCPECDVFHNLKSGRVSLGPPNEWDGVRCVRLCAHCRDAGIERPFSSGINIGPVSDAMNGPSTFSTCAADENGVSVNGGVGSK
jgi:hypothetical protein